MAYSPIESGTLVVNTTLVAPWAGWALSFQLNARKCGFSAIRYALIRKTVQDVKTRGVFTSPMTNALSACLQRHQHRGHMENLAHLP